MPKDKSNCDKWLNGDGDNDDPFVSHEQPMNSLRGSVREYMGPFEPLGDDDCAVLSQVNDSPFKEGHITNSGNGAYVYEHSK